MKSLKIDLISKKLNVATNHAFLQTWHSQLIHSNFNIECVFMLAHAYATDLHALITLSLCPLKLMNSCRSKVTVTSDDIMQCS